ncbi:hypothetical protein R1sor_016008 [Riccia sorocarpa]|uniref:Uncharacterized protein n=1 Tax=Riccia sorocarpa TaxID=122646 RepID=A0ABD3HGX7_9MARC
MSENPTENNAAESSFQGKDTPVKRRSVQFEDSPLELGIRSEPTIPDNKLPLPRSSLLKKSRGALDKTTIHETNVEIVNVKKQEFASAKDATSTFDGAVPVYEPLDNSASRALARETLAHNEMQEPQSHEDNHHVAETSAGLEIPNADPEQDEEEETPQSSQPPAAAENVDGNSLEFDNEGENEKVMSKSRRRSTTARRKSMKSSSIFKEITGTIEKKKGPNLPDKLGFGSSEERKALKVEKEKRKSSILVVPKEPEETPKPIGRRKSVAQGVGFGSGDRRKSAFDKDDPAKPKERKRSVLSNNVDEKEPTPGKSRRPSVDARASSSQQSASQTLIPQELRHTAVEVAQGEMNQASGEQQQSEGENSQQFTESDARKSPPVEGQQESDIPTAASDQSAHAFGAEMEGVTEVVREASAGDSDSSGIEPRMRDRPPSIYSSHPVFSSSQYASRAPSIDTIPLDDNEGLTSTLLAGKVHEPMLRNELESWLSSAINRVDNNLSSSWGDPVLRQSKDSTRHHSIPPARTPRNTMTVQPQSPDLSASSSPSKGSSTRSRRLSGLSLGILAGTISDENKLLPQPHQQQQQQQQQEVGESTGTPRLQVQGSSMAPKETITPRLAPKVLSTPSEASSDLDQETAQEGLKRLQSALEEKAWSQYFAKKSARLILPHSLRKRKMPGESNAGDYLQELHANKASPRRGGRDKILTKDLLCNYGGTEHPEKLRNAGLSSLDIVGVEQTDLQPFQNLHYVDLSVNRVNMNDLWPLSALRKLSLMSNQLGDLGPMHGQFNQLQALDLSYNILDGSAIVHLATLPALETLNLDHNSITEIPETSAESWSFPRLRIFSAAHNFLRSQALVPLSKMTRMEKLLLADNSIQGVPNEINEAALPFPRLELLDLTKNKVADCGKLLPLLRCHSLKQVLLVESPVAKNVACDGANKLLESARPVLVHILRAARAGQEWITELPEPQTTDFEEPNFLVIQQFRKPEVRLFDSWAKEEMAHVFKYTSEMIRKEAGYKHCEVHKGYSSAILPYTDGSQSPVMALFETKEMDHAKSGGSEVASCSIPPSMDEAMESVTIHKNLTENHLRDANAAIVCLQNTLGVPFREVTAATL